MTRYCKAEGCGFSWSETNDLLYMPPVEPKRRCGLCLGSGIQRPVVGMAVAAPFNNMAVEDVIAAARTCLGGGLDTERHRNALSKLAQAIGQLDEKSEVGMRELSQAYSRIIELETAIKAALQPLGTGKCECDGCSCEAEIAVEILRRVLR